MLQRKTDSRSAALFQPNPAAFILFFTTNVRSQEDFVSLILFTGHMTFFLCIWRGKLLLARKQASGGNCPPNNEKIKEIKIFQSAGPISAPTFSD